MTTQHNNQRRIPCFTLLWLAAAAFLMMATASVSAFGPSSLASSTIIRNGKTVLRADVAPSASDAAAKPAAAADGEHPKQSEYGKSLELPETYASCGQCGATYALTLEAMGPGKGGRYVSYYGLRIEYTSVVCLSCCMVWYSISTVQYSMNIQLQTTTTTVFIYVFQSRINVLLLFEVVYCIVLYLLRNKCQ